MQSIGYNRVSRDNHREIYLDERSRRCENTSW